MCYSECAERLTSVYGYGLIKPRAHYNAFSSKRNNQYLNQSNHLRRGNHINYFFNNAHENYINVLIICILVNAVPIYKGKYFLGDSGTLFLSSIIAFITIKSFNQNSINFSYEKIFLLFLIPGVDMLRLFVLRIANKKNPFLADRNHLHHILLDRFSLLKTNLVYLALIVIPLFIQILLNIQIIFCIIIGLIAYMIIILLKKL